MKENTVDVDRGRLCISLELLVFVLKFNIRKRMYLFVSFKCSCYDVERIQLPPTPANQALRNVVRQKLNSVSSRWTHRPVPVVCSVG